MTFMLLFKPILILFKKSTKKAIQYFYLKRKQRRTITEKFQWSETKNPSVGGNFGLICRPSNCWVSRRLRPKTQDPSKTKTPRKKLSFRGVLKKKKKFSFRGVLGLSS